MAKRTKKPQTARPALPERLRQSLDTKRTEGGLRSDRPTSRSVPHRQGASRGPRG